MRSISLARASEIENIVFDPAAHCWSAAGPLEAFVSVEFPENGAHYEEKAVCEQGAMKVTHTLTFQADLPDQGEGSITAGLEEAS
ncbi:MAG: hypothetical protein LBU95_03505, partial [Rikenellaceae bacterium]|nr:hypothetical protein [Rikenellaceae bacterium]